MKPFKRISSVDSGTIEVCEMGRGWDVKLHKSSIGSLKKDSHTELVTFQVII